MTSIRVGSTSNSHYFKQPEKKSTSFIFTYLYIYTSHNVRFILQESASQKNTE